MDIAAQVEHLHGVKVREILVQQRGGAGSSAVTHVQEQATAAVEATQQAQEASELGFMARWVAGMSFCGALRDWVAGGVGETSAAGGWRCMAACLQVLLALGRLAAQLESHSGCSRLVPGGPQVAPGSAACFYRLCAWAPCAAEVAHAESISPQVTLL